MITHHLFGALFLRCGRPIGGDRIGPTQRIMGLIRRPRRQHRIAPLDHAFGDLDRKIHHVATSMLAAKPIVDRLGRSNQNAYRFRLGHQAVVLTSATAPLARSSEHSRVSSADSMRRSEWPSLANGSCLIGCKKATDHVDGVSTRIVRLTA